MLSDLCIKGRSWRLRDGLLLERSLRLRPSWTPNGGWSEPEERMAEEPQNGPWEMSRSKIRETSEHEERDSFGGLSDAEAAGRDVSSLETFVDRSISGGGVQRSNEKVDEGTQTVDNSSEEGVTSGAPLAGALKAGPDDIHPHVVRKSASVISDISFVVLVAGCSAVAVFGVVAAGYCFYKVQKNARAAADVDYPAYGVTGPNKEGASPTADRKLAQSAQMYHFQHQKQQMIAVEKVIECKVPTNTRVYTVAVYFRRKRLATASGHSIQQAVMAAASKALEASKELFPQLSHQRRVLERILKQQAPSKEDEPPTKKSRDDSSTDSRSRHNSSSRSHGSLDRRRTSGETKRRSRSRSRDTSKPEA